MFSKDIYVDTVYGQRDNPYHTWLTATDEKARFQSWLRSALWDVSERGLFAPRTGGRAFQVLDLGCGAGNTSMRVIAELQRAGVPLISYTGVDPYGPQLEEFARHEKQLRILELDLREGSIESYVAERTFHLVIASHALYYTANMASAIARVAEMGHEVIIVHHGERGINTVQQAFRDDVNPGPHVVSTDEDVAEHVRGRKFGTRRGRHYKFASRVDVSCFGPKPDEKRARDLTSFFLERPIADIPEVVVSNVGAFMRQHYSPHFSMVHDVGVFTIS